MLLQEWSPSFVESLCFIAQRKINRLCCRKLSGSLENSRLGMNLHGCTEQQMLDGWRQVRAHAKTSLCRQQHDVRWRTINRKIADTGGQNQLVQKRIKCNVSVSARKVCKLDPFGSHKTLDCRRIPRRNNEGEIDIAGDQLFGRHLRCEVQ